jgi:hypothetical protein
MELQQHQRLLQVLQDEYLQKTATVLFTQWDTENEDEEVTRFRGQLTEMQLSDNEFDEKDLQLIFALEDGESVEILMEIPKEEADLAFHEADKLSIYGTEAELVLEK